ncbi:hypothetical protein [Pseudescherichia sp.]|uniref:DUF7279 family protein n=1 Tax=Pseudescherichia sp. TaxID=2055881 RepID=UPI0028A6A867|nr:hypothetical protein [Pseudescherichia sp.]
MHARVDYSTSRKTGMKAWVVTLSSLGGVRFVFLPVRPTARQLRRLKREHR